MSTDAPGTFGDLWLELSTICDVWEEESRLDWVRRVKQCAHECGVPIPAGLIQAFALKVGQFDVPYEQAAALFAVDK